MKIGRNNPCPCGSGKKYKHCCMSLARAISDELGDVLSGQEFDSIEEVQAIADTFMVNQNQKAQDDFLGLSSDQVYRMLNFAYDTPELFQFSEQLSIEPEAPIVMLMEGIISAIDEKGLKATAKGNLPQKLCKGIWSDYKKFCPDDIYFSFLKVNKEEDLIELHVTRIILELAGLLRKTKGRFYLTKKYQKIAKKSGLKGLYPIIFKTYCCQFNWGYWDRFSDVPFIQQSFLFTLYLLNQHGDKMTLLSVYEDNFLRAFPMVVNEIGESGYSTPEEDLRYCYSSRAIKRFLVFLGLAELEVIKSDKHYDHKYKIKKTPLFDAVMHFNLFDPKIGKTTILSSVRSDQLH